MDNWIYIKDSRPLEDILVRVKLENHNMVEWLRLYKNKWIGHKGNHPISENDQWRYEP
jgi:hypothetical protein